MKYLLSNQELIGSARILAEELNLRLSLRPLEEAPTVRWGNSQGEYSSKSDTKFNDPQLIRSSRKDLLSKILLNRAVPCVEIHPGTEDPNHYPIVLRNTLVGNGGAGIQVVDGEWPRDMHVPWSYWHQFSYELGVHLFNGNITRIFKKVWSSGSDEEGQYPIRNSDNGYRFSLNKVENYKKLPALISQFYSVFPIGFCRLDIGWDVESETYRIIECNSAPALTGNVNTLRTYAENLRSAI